MEAIEFLKFSAMLLLAMTAFRLVQSYVPFESVRKALAYSLH